MAKFEKTKKNINIVLFLLLLNNHEMMNIKSKMVKNINKCLYKIYAPKGVIEYDTNCTKKFAQKQEPSKPIIANPMEIFLYITFIIPYLTS